MHACRRLSSDRLRGERAHADTVALMEDRHAWERPGAHAVGPGIHRIPLPLPERRAARGQRVRHRGRRRARPDRRRLGDGRRDRDPRARRSARSTGGCATSASSSSRTCTATTTRRRSRCGRITGSPVSVGEGEKACLDAIHSIDVHPDIARMHRAGADDIAELLAGWHGERDVTYWEYPDRWLPDGIDLPLQSRTLRAIHTPGHTAGHMVFHDPQARRPVRGRPRPAAHHALDRCRAGASRIAAARLPRVVADRAGAAGRAVAAGARPGHGVHPRAGGGTARRTTTSGSRPRRPRWTAARASAWTLRGG